MDLSVSHYPALSRMTYACFMDNFIEWHEDYGSFMGFRVFYGLLWKVILGNSLMGFLNFMESLMEFHSMGFAY
jgi:hypothetical protein